MRAASFIAVAALLACGGSESPEAPADDARPPQPTAPPAPPQPTGPPAAPATPTPPASAAPSFAGDYSGSVADATSCSGGPVGRQTYETTWHIAQSGSTAVVTTSGNCPPYVADVEPSGIVAQFRPKTCPPVTRDGETMSTQFLGGTLTLSGDTMTATHEWLREFRDAASGVLVRSCRTSTAAAFTRVPL